MTGEQSNITLYFVIKTDYLGEEDASQDMKLAFKNATDWSVKSLWIKESDCASVNNQVKGQVFVFEEFKGDLFTNFLKSHRNRVVGPRCLLTCFAEQITIPWTKYPIYTMAMRELMICTSNVPAESKNRIEELIGFMGGDFNSSLTTSTTHLVVNSVLSKKYFKAVEQGIKVMKADWIEHVWKKSLTNDIRATDDDIIDEFKCPVFYNLKVTASSLTVNEKNNIKKCINSNGGTYTQEMTKMTNVLIIPFGCGEKFKFAERWKVKCINPSWIERCLEKVYAVPYEEFVVRSDHKKCSTPVKSVQTRMASLVDTNDSEISVIPSDSGKNVVDDSAPFDTQTAGLSLHGDHAPNIFKTPVKSVPRASSNKSDNMSYQKILDNIVLTDVKKCGPLLDGCKVYLAGFNANEEEKLRRILNYSGAMRFTELNESITHVIVGNPNKNDVQNIKCFPSKPHVVTLEWLSASIKKGCLEKETNCMYLCENREEESKQTSAGIQQPSPLSKKGLQILNPAKMAGSTPPPVVSVDQNLIEKYIHVENSGSSRVEPPAAHNNSADKRESIDQQTSNTSPSDKLFSGLRFAIMGHSPNATEEMKKTILDFGGSIASGNRTVIDYTIVPVTNTLTTIRSEAVVTSIWVEECLYENRIIETKYYHRPITIPDFGSSSPLKECVITFSSYGLCERQYLENVALFLGAKCQDVLSKKHNAERGAARTTHLVCACPVGVKYNAAIKWNLPVIKETWLLECFKLGRMLPVDSFLVDKNTNITAAIPATLKYAPPGNRSATSADEKPSSYFSAAGKDKDINFRAPESSLENVPVPPSTCDASSAEQNPARIPSRSRNTTNFGVTESDFKDVRDIPSTSVGVTDATNDKSRAFMSTKVLKRTANERRPTYAAVPSQADSTLDAELNHRSRNAKTLELPTGLLKKINTEASSSAKRKLNSHNSYLEGARVGSPKQKVPRLDAHNISSFEEVGWKDTLTDISQNHEEELPSSSEPDSAAKPAEPSKDARIPPLIEAADKPGAASNHVDQESSRIPVPGDRNQPVVEPTKGISELTNNPVGGSKNHLILNRRDRTNQLFQSTSKMYRNMLISVANNERKQQCENIIKSIGGRVLLAYETECPEEDRVTHLIIDDLKKTEKLLCSVASGLWVLHSSYLDECQKANKFVEEEKFEWGNPNVLPFKAAKENDLIAKAAYRWRRTIQATGLAKRPFVGMRAVILGSSHDESVRSLMRVVKSGGGVVLPTSDLLKATHCLLRTLKNLNDVPVPLKTLAERKIHLLQAVYLSDYLIMVPPPKPESCYLDIYKRCF